MASSSGIHLWFDDPGTGEMAECSAEEATRLLLSGYLSGSLRARLAGDTRESSLEEILKWQDSIQAKRLKLEGEIGKAEIAKAHRELSRQYHPDKTSTLGVELQELAEERFKEIGEAKRYLDARVEAGMETLEIDPGAVEPREPGALPKAAEAAEVKATRTTAPRPAERPVEKGPEERGVARTGERRKGSSIPLEAREEETWGEKSEWMTIRLWAVIALVGVVAIVLILGLGGREGKVDEEVATRPGVEEGFEPKSLDSLDSLDSVGTEPATRGVENEKEEAGLARTSPTGAMDGLVTGEERNDSDRGEGVSKVEPELVPEGTVAGQEREIGGIRMVWCPPGRFEMGSPPSEAGRDADESRHEVTLTRGYWLAKYECTQEEWERVMGSTPSRFQGSSRLPVEEVSWDDVQEWMAKMKERHPLPEGWEWSLPTEAQWEYACRAGTSGAYADELEEMGWFNRNSGNKTHEVGQKRANEWGLHDMHGNVLEWCADRYGDYPGGSVTDPEGAGSGSYRVLRGGSWNLDDSYCRSALRYRDSPAYRGNFLGFRIAVRVSAEKVAAERAAAEKAAAEKAAAERAAAEKVAAERAAAERAAAMIGRIAGEEREIGGIRMVWCPPGRFVMGSPPNEAERGADESQHEVTLTRGFWLAKYECTQEEWERVMGSNPSDFRGSSRLPVESVSWNDVQEWMEKMKERHPLPEGWEWSLPTEAQWEYACRAETEGEHAGELGEMAWYAGNSGRKTHEVGQKRANGWGLHDMHGNVFEWCADWYEDYPGGSVTDPEGPGSGSDRVVRGGGWFSLGPACRSAYRSRNSPDDRNDYLGFRPAVSSPGAGGAERR